MSKALLYEHIMDMDERLLKDTYPLGARQDGKRWVPAERKSKADKTLAGLLRDRKSREEKPEYLRRLPPMHVDRTDERGEILPPTAAEIERAAHDSAYTTDPTAAVHGAGNPVPAEYQAQITAAAHERFKEVRSEEIARAEVRSYMGRLKQLAIELVKMGLDPGPAFEAALAQLEEKKKAA